MTNRATVALFLIAGVLFLIAGLIPAFRGEGVNVVFFILGITFVILSAAFRGAGKDPEP